ncbi:addiction module antidote protein, HigA family [Brumimicrobium glaciale]|uniref:Addiction module antidote protein, HigA family n=1 Tax=Brumimicrobium glaciale TaxID=200475 RepID=A0A4Q4KQZ1_9FLAO|nr:HigA family addiction module antitoxin [Brumimicrobium glaciale]RYM34994.1 addiction module antidote protein, HigA family [Brumimicrobium glaciale]
MNVQENNKNRPSVLTERTDVGSQEFNEFQAILLNKSRERSNEQKRTIELLALKFKMEDYLNSKDKHSKKVGDFIKAYLKAFDIRQYKFAEYIGIKPSNLTKLIKGERSLNHELALILGSIFGNDPMLWLDIQDKNKLYELSKNKKDIKKYSLDDLIA